MTYKEYLIEEVYYRDPKCKQYESFDDWLGYQDIDDIISWADLYVKELLSKKSSFDRDIKKKILEMRYEDWKNIMPPLNVIDNLSEPKEE